MTQLLLQVLSGWFVGSQTLGCPSLAQVFKGKAHCLLKLGQALQDSVLQRGWASLHPPPRRKGQLLQQTANRWRDPGCREASCVPLRVGGHVLSTCRASNMQQSAGETEAAGTLSHGTAGGLSNHKEIGRVWLVWSSPKGCPRGPRVTCALVSSCGYGGSDALSAGGSLYDVL